MASPDDFGLKRAPTFLNRGGKPMRAPEPIEGTEFARDLVEAATNAQLRQVNYDAAQLRQVHDAVAHLRGPVVEPPTRLQEIAAAMLALPYGDFVEMSEGIKAAGSTELATLIHAWAKANVRGRNDP